MLMTNRLWHAHCTFRGMLVRYLPLVFMLCGCEGRVLYTYTVDNCSEIQSEVELNPDALAFNWSQARIVLVESGIVPTEATYREVFCGIPIYVRQEHSSWGDCRPEAPSEACETGHYYPFGGIVIHSWGYILVHELLHAWDYTHLDFSTNSHQGWLEKGYYKITDLYESKARDLTRTIQY